MTNGTQSGSILFADFGSVNTRVVLVDMVDGEYRLVARSDGRTTAGYPVDDVSAGLQRILMSMSEITRRRFYDDSGQIIMPEQADRSGVDSFIATASAGRPMRVVVAGLAPDLSVASAAAVVAASYARVVATIDLLDGRSTEERLNAILLARPDLILIVGGSEKGADRAVLEIAQAVRLSMLTQDQQTRPALIYAGNSALTARVEKLFENLATLNVTPNVRPGLEREDPVPLALELARAYGRFRETRSESYRRISLMSSGVQPTGSSYRLVAEYYARTRKTDVLALDMGGSTAIAVVADSELAVMQIDPQIGLGESAPALLERLGADAIRAWLPFEIGATELRNYVMNKAVRPATLPMNVRDFFIEYALLRAGLRCLLHSVEERYGDLPSAPGLILLGGAALAWTGNPSLALLLAADLAQTGGIAQVATDPSGVIPAIGALARSHPEAATQLLEANTLEHLGSIVRVDGPVKRGASAMRLKITTDDGEVFEHTIQGGDVWALPLQPEDSLSVDIRLEQGLSINGKRRIKMRFSGGTAGLLFDARGRHLPVLPNATERAALWPAWVAAATGDDPLPIPEDWLEPVVELAPMDEEAMEIFGSELDQALPGDFEAGAGPGLGRLGKQRSDVSVSKVLKTAEVPAASGKDKDKGRGKKDRKRASEKPAPEPAPAQPDAPEAETDDIDELRKLF